MIIIDTNFFVALINTRDNNHPRAIELLKEISNNIYGQRITIDYVLDEAITTTWVRTKKQNLVKNIYEMIYGNISIYDLKTVTENLITKAWDIHNQYFSEKKPLSFTDCMIIAFATEHAIKYVLSFNDEFDGILNRIC